MHANDAVTAFEKVAGRRFCPPATSPGSRCSAVDSHSFAFLRGFPCDPLCGAEIPEPDGRANAVERGHVLIAFEHPGRAPRHRSPFRSTVSVTTTA